ncbi:MAG: iron-sulfur cluster repair di-iron protein [Akkermansiaceae bacterium]|jgi:regulator of cell morphogenesis and NO signaling|nr:iron-sulfur cluster repair di-iron protein [Akkermansiaceae bacterium]
MSHSTIEYSPVGTPVLERTVGELVAERPSRSRIFQARGVDFCCQGGRTLLEACQRRDIDPEEMVTMLEKEEEEPAPEENPAELGPLELVDYIVKRHHGFLRGELPRLHEMAARVARVHGPHTPSLVTLLEVFEGMMFELAHHLMKEEDVLFPAIGAMVSGETAGIPLDGAIATMMDEHEDAGRALQELRELTNGFRPPEGACNTYRALFAGLLELEGDLHRHIHLENSVLFPAAKKLAGI